MSFSRIARTVAHFTSSMAWLAFLYLGLLYVAVGALGVSEVVSRFGEQAVYVFHTVTVVDELRQQQKQDVKSKLERLRSIDKELEAAVRDLRTFGISAGLPLEKIQPIIDNYDHAPRLTDLLGKSVEVSTEQDWASRMATVMNLQSDRDRLRTEVQKTLTTLKQDWSSEIHLGDSASSGGRKLSETDIDVAASTASTLRRLGYGVLFSLPREILTLVLAMSMGAMGSTLHITKVLLDTETRHRTSWYVIRPFQGMVSALVLYVVLKAGQMTISSQGGDGLNNFFVAFVGIIAGLMSQEAYHAIQKAGTKLIPPDDDGGPRWAFKLKAAMAAAGVEAEPLAAGIGADVSELRRWIDEKEAVPPLQQKLIASWLHLPAREIFTAEPPEGQAAPPAAPTPVETMPEVVPQPT